MIRLFLIAALLTELNKSAVEEVSETVEESVRSKPVRTFLSNRIKNLKWHPVGNTVRRFKNKG